MQWGLERDRREGAGVMSGRCERGKRWVRIVGSAGVAAVMGVAGWSGGCTHKVEVEVTRVAPIHMTLDVNLRVQRELEEVFDFRWKNGNSGVEKSGQGAVQNGPEAPGVKVPEGPGPTGSVSPALPGR